MADIRVINFMGKRKLASAFSLLLVVVSLGSLIFNGLNYGLDFTGGTQVEVYYEEVADLDRIRALLEEEGFESYEVAYFGSDNDVLVRIQDTGSEEVDPEIAARTGERVVDLLREENGGSGVQLQRSEYVGSVVGEELREQGGLGILVALGMMMIYIAVRFQFKFAMATVAALAEDVLITLGFFSVLQLSFDLSVLAALLAVIGYGLNDTVVICDRIRENFRILRKMDTTEIINISLSQTLSRTVITSMTTLLVLVTLALFGGETLRGFSVALMVGVVIATYSSLFVATNVLLSMHITKEDLMPPEKDEELDAIP